MCCPLCRYGFIFSYWCSYHTEKHSLWVLSAFFLIVLQCFGMITNELNGYLHLYIISAVLAGIGVAGIFTSNEKRDESISERGSLVEDKRPEGETVEKGMDIDEVVLD